jgi:DNA-binding transcriptional regulator YdaS (Cro superfamily)
MRNIQTDSAIRAAGGTSALAKKIGVTPQAISQWGVIPHARVAQVSLATGIPREELRPDLFRVLESQESPK